MLLLNETAETRTSDVMERNEFHCDAKSEVVVALLSEQ